MTKSQNSVDKIEEIVLSYAKKRKTITYSGLTQATDGLRPHRYWHDLLMKLSKQSLEKYGLDLAILVVSKVTGLPGNGFYMSLHSKDLEDWNNNPQEYFDRKTKEIFDYFASDSQNDLLIFGNDVIDFLG